jgi:hypothetical protein
MKHGVMLVHELLPLDSKHGIQNLETLESLVARLVACSDGRAHASFRRTLVGYVGLHTARKLSNVAQICFHTLIWKQHPGKIGAKDFDVGPKSGLKRPIHPHNVTSADANSNFLTNTRPIKLVAVVCTGEWARLLNPKISAVDRDETIVANVVDEAVSPHNLPRATRYAALEP